MLLIKRFAIEILLLFCVLNEIKGQIRPTDPPPTPSDNPCLEPEGFFPIPGTCGSDYYVCVSGSPYIQTCPNGTIFDPETLLCLAPEEASCGPGATSRATTSTEAITTTVATEETIETTTEMPTSSTETTLSTTTTSMTTTQAGQFVCPPGAPAANYPYPGDCTKYYSCTSDGRLFINTCPTNLWYSIQAEFCESKEIVAQQRPECSLNNFTGRNVKPNNIKKWPVLFDRIWSKLTA